MKDYYSGQNHPQQERLGTFLGQKYDLVKPLQNGQQAGGAFNSYLTPSEQKQLNSLRQTYGNHWKG